MLLLRLIFRNAFRHKLRTGLTIASVALAILAFGLLRSGVNAWDEGIKASCTMRLITRNALSFTSLLPISYMDKISRIAGVKAVSYGRWAGQASLSFVKDDEMMRLAAKSGCAALFFGVESVSQGNLTRMAKAIKDVPSIEEAIKKVHDHGILFHPSFIFGFDNDTKDIFPETLEFIFRNRIGTAGFNVLTPYPGTKIYEQFHRENRIITTDWKYYNLKHVVFRPRYMSPFELHTGRFWLIKEFTRLSTIARNWQGIPSNNFGVLMSIYLAFTLGYRKEINKDIRKFPSIAPILFPGEVGDGGTDVSTKVKSSFEGYAKLYNDFKLQKKRNS